LHTRAHKIQPASALPGKVPEGMEPLHPTDPLDPGHYAALRVEARDAGSLHLVKSKLKPPLPAATGVPRPDLLARMDSASRGKLLLLVAPIGSGKTSLLAQWHRHAGARRSIAWLSLDEGDDEPVRFFSYLIAAIRTAAPGFDAYIPSRHDERQGPDGTAPHPVATVVSESLGRLQQELVIVLDDLQWLTAPPLLRMLDLLLQRSPDNVHWVLSGRRMSELNLVPLRLNDQLLTIDAADLNFDGALIMQLGRKLCRRPLSEPEAESIRTRTEGWVAGVKLALLAAADPGAAGEALQQFTGSHSEVTRYLGASVLQEQSAELRDFLVASSVVDRMTGELCNALLGISHSQSLLEQLERSQLFIQPLDSHAHWYRYHTLFLDFLRSCLRHDAARIPLLHERASRWFAEHQLYEEALQHAFAGTNAQWRIELLARCASTWPHNGEVAELIRWCEKLPRAEVMAHEEIRAGYIFSLILSRRFDDAESALRETQQQAAAGQPVNAVRLRVLQMMLAVLSDSSSDIDPAACDALRSEGADGFLIGNLLTLQAYAALRRHRFDIAWRLAMRARDTLEKISPCGVGYASVVASLAERAQGDVRSAAKRCEQIFATMRGGRPNPAWITAAIALAYVRYEENRLSDAEALCAEALPLMSVACTIEDCSTAYVTLARIKAANERPEEAFRLLDYLHSVLESGHHQRFLAQVCGEKIRLCLAQGRLERALAIAAQWNLPQLAQAREWHTPRPYDEAWERLGFAHVSLLMHQQDPAAAIAILTVLRDSAHAVGYAFREVPLEAALAACHWGAGEHDAAFDALNRGFALTRGHGFPRSVFDEVPALIQVVTAALKQRKLRELLPTRYFCRFENLLGSRAGPAPPAALRSKSALPLEPLTDREIDMLKLLAQGLSNQEISVHSQIALSTTKWHLKNVFAKLDVSTRTGAIARARELQLIG
jgi:LuxR family maltose regulon positive regulatory protein